MRMPARARARMAAWAPGPGLRCLPWPGARTLTWTPTIPFSRAVWATLPAICIAAYGELSLRSCLTTMPPLDLVTVSAPDRSVMVMMVLLNDAKIWAMPHFSFSFAAILSPSSPCRVGESARGRLGVGCGFCYPDLFCMGVTHER